MRIWGVMCKDNKTGLEMILSEAGYNEVCLFIEQNFKIIRDHHFSYRNGNQYLIVETDTRDLIYDAQREVLVGT